MRAFEGCAHEVSHLTTQTKKDEPSLWMGKYLKPGRLAQTSSTYFRPEGASSTIFPAGVNANLSDVSDGPMKDKCSVNLSKQDTEVTEALYREAAALQNHLLWVTDLLMLLAQRLEQPNAAVTIQPILSKVLDNQKSGGPHVPHLRGRPRRPKEEE